jgi:hypothetical protein
MDMFLGLVLKALSCAKKNLSSCTNQICNGIHQMIFEWLAHEYDVFPEIYIYIIIFKSLPFKNILINSVANLILYNLRGSSLHMIRLQALTQETCP